MSNATPVFTGLKLTLQITTPSSVSLRGENYNLMPTDSRTFLEGLDVAAGQGDADAVNGRLVGRGLACVLVVGSLAQTHTDT